MYMYIYTTDIGTCLQVFRTDGRFQMNPRGEKATTGSLSGKAITISPDEPETLFVCRPLGCHCKTLLQAPHIPTNQIPQICIKVV